MTAVTPLVETNEGHQGTLLLRATRIKQESITSCITDNVSPKKSDLHSKQQLLEGFNPDQSHVARSAKGRYCM